MTITLHSKTTLMDLFWRSKAVLVWSISCLALLLIVLVDVAIPCLYSGSDYFNITIGHGIKYQVTDSGNSLDCSIWAVSRPRNGSEFAFSLTRNGNEEASFRNSWLGGEYVSEFGAYMFNSECPSDNQADLYFMFALADFFDSGYQWVIYDKEYMVEHIGEYHVNGSSFNNCIKVSVDNSQDSDEFLKGNGYFVLAQSIGIVQLVFNRDNGDTVLFEYLEHDQQILYTLSGTISSTTGGSVEGLVVQISNCDNEVQSIVDVNGFFTITAFGPDVVIRVGYDDDGNGELDPDDYPDYPKEYHINCLTSEVTTFDSGLDVQINVSPPGSSSTSTTISIDADGDGVSDDEDNCPDIPNADQENSDSDSHGDVCDNCWEIANPDQLDSDGDCLGTPYDSDPKCGDACELIDTDGDGISDDEDNCPDIPNADQENSDSDSHGDACDNCFYYGNEDQADADGDGIGNICDNCPGTINPNQYDKDGDDIGNICDNCWEIVNPDQLDSDGNCLEPPYDSDPKCGDACELIDADGDGVSDDEDNCPDVPNADQANSDSDSYGDACDNCSYYGNEDQTDADGDGIGNVCDNCWEAANPDQLDSDGNCFEPPYYRSDPKCGDACDLIDADGDGVSDDEDNCPNVPNADQANSDSDSYGDACDNCSYYGNEDQTDADGDGIGNVCDNCWEAANPDQLDSDGDCFEPPYYRADPKCGDACESPLEVAIVVLGDAIDLENEAETNMMEGDIDDLKQLIKDCRHNLDYTLVKVVESWKNDKLGGISAIEGWGVWLTLKIAANLNGLAIEMLERDQYWRRRSAKLLLQMAIYFKEYAREILER